MNSPPSQLAKILMDWINIIGTWTCLRFLLPWLHTSSKLFQPEAESNGVNLFLRFLLVFWLCLQLSAWTSAKVATLWPSQQLLTSTCSPIFLWTEGRLPEIIPFPQWQCMFNDLDSYYIHTTFLSLLLTRTLFFHFIFHSNSGSCSWCSALTLWDTSSKRISCLFLRVSGGVLVFSHIGICSYHPSCTRKHDFFHLVTFLIFFLHIYHSPWTKAWKIMWLFCVYWTQSFYHPSSAHTFPYQFFPWLK